MTPLSSCSIENILDDFAAAEGWQIVEVRAQFVFSNLLMGFLKGKQLSFDSI